MLVERSLESVVQHVELRKIERDHGAKIGADVKVRSAKITRAIRKIRIERLQRLVQIADLMVPQASCTSADIANLRHPGLCELVLDAKIPFENARYQTLGTAGAHETRRIGGINGEEGGSKARRDQLRGGWNLANIEGTESECQLRRIQA